MSNKSPKKRLLITGASGFLGNHLCEELHSDYDIIAIHNHNALSSEKYRSIQCDIVQRDDFTALLENATPDVIIHLAAVTSMADCLKDSEGSSRLNVHATDTLTQFCKRNSIPLYFASSDLVFSGEVGEYSEDATPDPICEYGRQKAKAEEFVLNHPLGIVCRLPLILGYPVNDQKSYLQHFIAQAKAGKQLNLFTDEWRTPVEVRALAKAFRVLLKNQKSHQVYHLACPQSFSRFSLGESLAELLNIPAELLNATEHASVQLSEPRPKNVTLSISRIHEIGFHFPELIGALQSDPQCSAIE